MSNLENQPQSFMKSVFEGQIPENLVFPFPDAKAEENELVRLIQENLSKFAQEQISSSAIDHDEEIPEVVLQGLKDLGLFGLMIGEEHGGVGLSQVAYSRVFETVSAIDGSIAVTLGAHQSIGLKALLLYGTEDQKKKYLPKLASGEWVAAFALTEPGAGSDAYSIKTKAVAQSDGSYVLNGNKIWISNGGFAHFFTVFAKTESVSATGEKKEKVSAFIVTRDMKGVSTGPSEKKLGIRGSSTTEVSFDNVRVPAENLIGQAGYGFKMAMEVLNSGRLGLAAGCVGGAKRLLHLASDHAKHRKQFGRSISEFGLIKEKLGQMAVEIYAVEAMTYLTCSFVDRGLVDYSIESALCKIAGSEMLWFVANEATQIAGGSSYMREYPYEQALRDARINMIFEGTNEILTAFVALSGMRGVGENLKEVGKALREPIKGFGVLSDYVTQKISRSISGATLMKAHPLLKKEAGKIEDGVVDFANSVEKVLQKHRKNIVEAQFAQKRIARIALDLFGMIAVVSRATKELEKQETEAHERLLYARIFCYQAWKRIRDAFREMDRNVDEEIKEVSKKVVEAGGFPLDLFSTTD